jgi:hypothetical protein
VETLREVLILVRAEDFPSEKLPEVATEALVRGVDSPLLRELAGGPTDDHQDLRDLFVATMAELGLPVPTREDAIWERVYGWAAEMVAGTLDPYEASSSIGLFGWDKLGRPQELHDFEWFARLWDADPDHGPELAKAMLREARALLERRGLS